MDIILGLLQHVGGMFYDGLMCLDTGAIDSEGNNFERINLVQWENLRSGAGRTDA